jgi:thioredoxin reductase (NADPH)
MGTPVETDAVVIGAGPVGLFQVFELGLLEIRAHVVDSLPQPGGQPMALYPDKPIYDIPGILACTGRSLTDALMRQIEPFGATFHLGQTVRSLQSQPDGRFALETSTGTRLLTKTIFIAAGVGAFEPRSVKADGLAAFEGTQVFHRVDRPADFAGRHLVVTGDEDDALDWASTFAEEGPDRAASVVLLHRRDAFRASPDAVERMRALCAANRMRFVAGQITGIEQSAGRLTGLQITAGDASTQVLPVDTLLVLMGLSPKLGPVADWGLALERKQLVVDTEKFATSVPGIFAVGDINTYPGKRKLILCGFHESTLAAFAAAEIVFPGKRVMLQYTTTSPRLHQLLGVPTPSAD